MANARGVVFLDGLDEIIEEFDRTIENIDKVAARGLEKGFEPIKQQMKTNALNTFTKGYAQGVMVNSIDYHVVSGEGGVTGSVGVYDMSQKTGSAERRLPEPVIAYFYEFGMNPFSTRPKRQQTKMNRAGEEFFLRPEVPPMPFLSSAFDAGSANIFNIVEEELTKHIVG